ncbi:MAG: tRNA (N(6)-L-threonylcarbamoyladenosine(37)-C(2))-methylthiotransferase MtaB [Flavobacteriia bacterium]|nr:tRNA (N(6)-L-threonylcarbamoyladenosine(37)-C(2))-methylthiotransferase MtaB [Flavobacteriia bacterium]
MKETVDSRRRAAYYTLGCKLNYAETSAIARSLEKEGYQRVDFGEQADLTVINTCSVTENADRETRSIVSRALRSNPDSQVVLTGCYAQLRPEEVGAIPGVDLVLGAQDKFQIARFLGNGEKRTQAEVHSCAIEEVDQFIGSYSIGDRTRSFLKVQDGCDYKCTYCTIPKARGISRSDRLENVVQKATEIAAQGIKEIVLTGVNTGDYGKGEFGNKKHEHTFMDLLQALDQVSGIDRIRISSLEPNLLHEEMVEFVARSHRFVPHFHLPLQSGNDEILGKMKRRYRRALYRERLDWIKEQMPDACIGADVLVGFPGETEQHFADTHQFLSDLPLSYLHVFTYSERPGTEAVSMDQVVPMPQRKERNQRLRLLSEKKRNLFYRSHIGSQRRVLWEAKEKDGMMQGYTENYIRLHRRYDAQMINQLEQVRVGPADKKGRLQAL